MQTMSVVLFALLCVGVLERDERDHKVRVVNECSSLAMNHGEAAAQDGDAVMIAESPVAVHSHNITERTPPVSRLP
jgi:hypothetical protein